MDEGTPDEAARRARGREYELRYREAHRAEVNERGRRWKLENPEKVREQRRRDTHVVVDDLAFCEPRLGVEDLVEIRELEPAPLELDLDVG